MVQEKTKARKGLFPFLSGSRYIDRNNNDNNNNDNNQLHVFPCTSLGI